MTVIWRNSTECLRCSGIAFTDIWRSWQGLYTQCTDIDWQPRFVWYIFTSWLTASVFWKVNNWTTTVFKRPAFLGLQSLSIFIMAESDEEAICVFMLLDQTMAEEENIFQSRKMRKRRKEEKSVKFHSFSWKKHWLRCQNVHCDIQQNKTKQELLMWLRSFPKCLFCYYHHLQKNFTGM